VVEEDGTKRFVASVQGRGGLSEEVVAQGVIHGGTSGLVMGFLGESLCPGHAITGRVGKPRPGRRIGERRNFRGDGKSEGSWISPGLVILAEADPVKSMKN
jgi:hypothetical protein